MIYYIRQAELSYDISEEIIMPVLTQMNKLRPELNTIEDDHFPLDYQSFRRAPLPIKDVINQQI
jgi:hypothetical protein